MQVNGGPVQCLVVRPCVQHSARPGRRRQLKGNAAKIEIVEPLAPVIKPVTGYHTRHEPAYPKAICLALVDGIDTALRSPVHIDRWASRLLAVAPTVRTKGAEPVQSN